MRRLMRRCAGLLFMPSEGVFLWSRIASQGSVPSLLAFLIRFFAVFTALLAIPLDCECPGLEPVTWLNSQSRANLLNPSESNCGPLSDVFRQCLAKCCFNLYITALDVVLDSNLSTSQ